MLKTLSEQIQGELAKRNKYFCLKHCRKIQGELEKKKESKKVFLLKTLSEQIQGELAKRNKYHAQNTVGTDSRRFGKNLYQEASNVI